VLASQLWRIIQNDFWIGHGEKTVSDVDKEALTLKQKRWALCEQAGLGFNLEVKKVLQMVSKG
jgi:hypothetical protein